MNPLGHRQTLAGRTKLLLLGSLPLVIPLPNWSYALIIFSASFAGQWVLNKDPTVWLDGVWQTHNSPYSVPAKKNHNLNLKVVFFKAN